MRSSSSSPRAPSLSLAGIKFGLNDWLRSLLPAGAASDGQLAAWTFFAGAFSGAVAHAVTFPLDTLRRRMQISGAQVRGA